MTEELLLFAMKPLTALFNEADEKISGLVDDIPAAQFLNSPNEVLVEHILSKLEICPLVVDFHRATLGTEETSIQAALSGFTRFPQHIIRAEIHLPFFGDSHLWQCAPTQPCGRIPRGFVRVSRLDTEQATVTVDIKPGEDDSAIKGRVTSELALVRQYLAWQEDDIKSWQKRAGSRAYDAVRRRRERLLLKARLPDVLGIPLRRRQDAPDITTISMARKLVRPLPEPPTSAYAPEPGISTKDFEHILSVIRHEGRSFESTPKTYSRLKEEELRDILLAHLNGHYHGLATGETFRKAGKTDIRIEDMSRAAFVAECKLWSGQKAVAEACEQLLSYLTWRDCKAALVFFNKTVGAFSSVLEALSQALETHPLHRSVVLDTSPGEWRHRFASREDSTREVILHTFVFNIFPPNNARTS